LAGIFFQHGAQDYEFYQRTIPTVDTDTGKVELILECLGGESIPFTLHTGPRIPFVHSDTEHWIPCDEQEYNANFDHLGKGRTFPLRHVTALQEKTLPTLIVLDRGGDVNAQTDVKPLYCTAQL